MDNVQRPVTITVSTVVNAPMEKVWHYFNEPEHITKWAFASDDWHAPSATNDLRVGGKFSTVMAAKDGSFQFEFGGEYVDVKDQERIEYNLGDGRNVKVSFTQQRAGVKITEEFDPENANPIEMQRNGWQAIMDNFKKYAEAQ